MNFTVQVWVSLLEELCICTCTCAACGLWHIYTSARIYLDLPFTIMHVHVHELYMFTIMHVHVHVLYHFHNHACTCTCAVHVHNHACTCTCALPFSHDTCMFYTIMYIYCLLIPICGHCSWHCSCPAQLWVLCSGNNCAVVPTCTSK